MKLGKEPITITSMRPICDYPDAPDRHAVRVGNHVVDAQDQPWVYCSLADAPSGGLYQLAAGGWIRHEMGEALDGLLAAGGRSTALSRAADGGLHLLLATSPDPKQHTAWYDASHEVFHLALDGRGKRRSLRQVTKTDAGAAHWLPSIEAWDWTRKQKGCGGGHWFTYTSGLNKGGIGGDNKSAEKTEVVLQRLGG
jgi:hypothetical protein